MSAIRLEKEGIEFLIHLTTLNQRSQFRYIYCGSSYEIGSTVCFDHIGRTLDQANLISIRARYKSHQEEDISCDETYNNNLFINNTISTAQALQGLRYYMYQTCEFAEWEKNEAYAICKYLKDMLIDLLIEQEDVNWGIPEPD